MKAWQVSVLGNPAEVLQLGDKTLQAPKAGELQIAVSAAAIGLPDVMMCRGSYEYKPDLPFTPGQEVAGTVVDVGEGVSFRSGQRVMGVTSFFNGDGGFAQQCMSTEGMVYPLPEAMPDNHAAAFTIAYHTAWISLVERGKLQPGETLLVLGAAGGSGTAAIQLGKVLGARVIAVAGSEEKLALCRVQGADHLLDHRHQDVAEGVREITQAGGADVIFDPVGGESALALSCIANGGRILAVGFAAGQWLQPATHDLVMHNASLLGVFVGAYSAEQRAGVHEQLLKLYRTGELVPQLAGQVGFADIPGALASLEAREVSGKLIALVD